MIKCECWAFTFKTAPFLSYVSPSALWSHIKMYILYGNVFSSLLGWVFGICVCVWWVVTAVTAGPNMIIACCIRREATICKLRLSENTRCLRCRKPLSLGRSRLSLSLFCRAAKLMWQTVLDAGWCKNGRECGCRGRWRQKGGRTVKEKGRKMGILEVREKRKFKKQKIKGETPTKWRKGEKVGFFF